jgi:valyl-tRNA synthetase
MKQVPWKRLYLHGLVRAADGQKMSKSKGNVVDPLVLIDKFGADALRFFMCAMESQGRDVKMDERRVEGYRNFATKLWNAARFLQSNGVVASQSAQIPQPAGEINKWLVGEVIGTVQRIDAALEALRFDEAAIAAYHFAWDRFCDDYIEDIKASFDDETLVVAGWAFDQILVMLHPFMPFITEELWHAMGSRKTDLIVAEWLDVGAGYTDEYLHAATTMVWVHQLIGEVRSVRAELGVAPGAIVPLVPASDVGAVSADLLVRFGTVIARRARVSIEPPRTVDGARAQLVLGGETFLLPLEGIIDIAAERTRLAKALEASTKEAKSLAARLANPAFVEKAKPEAVEKARADHGAHAAEAARLAAALARLG